MFMLMDKGEKIALARKYHAPALNQEQLSALLGVPRGTLARWETRGNPPVDVIRKVSQITAIPETWFFDGGDEPPPMPGAREESPNVRWSRNAGEADESVLSFARGDEVSLAVWRGVSAGFDGDCVFLESTSAEFMAVPAFLAGHDPHAHAICIASGVSMFPRVDHGEKVIIKLDPNPPVNSIVVARKPDVGNFIKALRRTSAGRLELHSLNKDFQPICDVDGWELRGYAVAILHTYEPGAANIEWDASRPLRA
jgi:phage repressor protein C with HTH and peptisase S24 domain